MSFFSRLTFYWALSILFCSTVKGAEVTALPMRCWLIGTPHNAADISGGAVTSAEFDAREGLSGLGGGMTQLPSYLKVGIDITDANNGISLMAISFTASQTTGGTFRDVDVCAQSGVVFTCGDVSLQRVPTTYGKVYWIKPIDWGYPFGKIIATPTGHGASDTITTTIYGCAE